MIQRHKEAETLGERLRRRREALGFSIKQVAHEIQAPERYLNGLEDDIYEVFPAKVYAHGFLKKLLAALTFPESDNFLREFGAEWEVRMHHKNQVSALPTSDTDHLYFTPQRLGIIFGGGALLLVLLLLSTQFIHFVSTPTIRLDEPRDQEVLEKPTARIKGKTEKESQLTVNGREITIDSSGNFDEEIELAAGLNALEFLAKNRFGKEAKAVRYVLVK